MKQNFNKLTMIFLFLFFLSSFAAVQGQNKPNVINDPTEIIRIVAPELKNLNFDLSTGGLKVASGLETYLVIRSNREHPELAEGLGWTYQHHPDIAVWHGRLFVGWNSCQMDEDTWPSRELISSSVNGKDWTKPTEMFPQGVSTPLRMYFYLSPNRRMLLIAGLRKNQERTKERDKNSLVVREILADHSLGNIFTLKSPDEFTSKYPLPYDKSPDKGFIEACKYLLSDNIYLQQQDYGNMVDAAKRMKWNNPENWSGNDELKKEAENFGKAMCFFERKDGALVGIGKKRWVTVSVDNGKTWAQPTQPQSLITGMGKVWGQRTSDGRYALIYNPDLTRRWPLVMLTSDDGITFYDPVALHGDLPQRRYEGLYKDAGLSYHRGLSKWNNDGSIKDDALWMVYSLNKEDIRVIRVPLVNNNL
jgi:hypothetical protein